MTSKLAYSFSWQDWAAPLPTLWWRTRFYQVPPTQLHSRACQPNTSGSYHLYQPIAYDGWLSL